MRASVNGKAIGELDSRLEHALSLRRSHGPVDGAILSEDEVIGSAAGAMKLLFGVADGGAILVMVMPIVLVAAKAPQVLAMVVAITIATAALISGALFLTYRLRLTGLRVRVGANLPRTAAPGTPVQVTETGLTVGSDTWAWSDLTIEAVDIKRTHNEATITTLDRLLLSAGGREVLLDRELTRNGRLIVDQAWRYLRPAAGR